MSESGKYIKLILRINIGLLATSFFGMVLTFLYLDPIKYNFAIWIITLFLTCFIFALIVVTQYLFRFIIKKEIIFRETIDDFLYTSSFSSGLITLIGFLIYTSQLNLITFGLILFGSISYAIFRSVN
jgi:hypothetical protein